MNKDITRYFTKHMSLSNIKTDELPKTEEDITQLVERAEENPNLINEAGLSDYQRGIIYFFGLGQIRDEKDGLYYLKLAADTDDMDAVNVYGFANYHMSLNCKDNPLQAQRYGYMALKLFMKAAESGQIEAMFNLGVCYIEGKITDTNYDKGRTLIEEAGKAGHPRAELYLKDLDIKNNPKAHITRENDKEKVIQDIIARLKPELAGIPKNFSMVGLFNDVYLDNGYKWVKLSDEFGWMASKNDGETYLITESELEEIKKRLLEDE